jgi:hypothetical protein
VSRFEKQLAEIIDLAKSATGMHGQYDDMYAKQQEIDDFHVRLLALVRRVPGIPGIEEVPIVRARRCSACGLYGHNSRTCASLRKRVA